MTGCSDQGPAAADRIPPPWLDGPTDVAPAVPAAPASVPADAGRWYKGMRSPNPKGRPRGVVDRRTKVTQALLDDGLEIARVVTEAAKEGDLQACSLVLSRIAPALKPETYPVQFAFDASAPIAAQIEAVLTAMADGAVFVDVGKQVIESVRALAEVRAVEELDARLTALEARSE